jgi:hypothetical protein
VTREASLPKSQGGYQEDAGSREERQEPIIAGTPLDEMPPATGGPLAGQGLLSLQPRKPEERRGDSGDTLKPSIPTIHQPVAEEDEEAVQTESDMGASRPGSAGEGVRPGFPAVTHEMGSVSGSQAPSLHLLAPCIVPADRLRLPSFDVCTGVAEFARVLPLILILHSSLCSSGNHADECFLLSYLRPAINLLHNPVPMPLQSFRRKVRMGASALVSALNALPWEGEDEESSSSEDEEAPRRRMGASMAPRRTFRPQSE